MHKIINLEHLHSYSPVHSQLVSNKAQKFLLSNSTHLPARKCQIFSKMKPSACTAHSVRMDTTNDDDDNDGEETN